MTFTPDGKSLITGSDPMLNSGKKTLRVWDTSTGKMKLDIKEQGHVGEVVILVAKPDSKQFVAWVAHVGEKPADAIHLVETYDLETGKQVATFNVHEKVAKLSSLTFSANGKICAVGDPAGKVHIFDIAEKALIGTPIDTKGSPIADLTLTPDARKLITGDTTGTVKVWDLANRAKPLHTIEAHQKPIVGFAVSADSKRFATASMDSIVKVWDLTTGKPLREWDMKVPYQLNKQFVRGLCFTAGGKQLVTGNGDSTLYQLDVPD